MAELAPNPEAADRRPLKSRSYGWVRRLASALVRANISPNGISVFGVLLASIAFAVLWMIARGWIAAWLGLLVAVLCVQGRLMCNLLDRPPHSPTPVPVLTASGAAGAKAIS